MIRENHDQHPDLDTLVAYSEDRLDALDTANLAAHLKSCAVCRLELLQFHRFNTLDSEPSAEKDSGWDEAKLELDNSWKQKIQPSFESSDGQQMPPVSVVPPRRISRGIWFVPAAAAALAAVIFFNPASGPEPVSPGSDTRVVRGAEESDQPGIVLSEPEGALDLAPTNFVWKTEVQCDHFALEVFTANLETVIMAHEITTSSWVLSPKEKAKIELGTTYFWKVRGYRDLQPVAKSGNQWFKVGVIGAGADSLHQAP